MAKKHAYIRWFEELNSKDVPIVGGKNASLGEMIRELKDKGISVPDGFATTAEAYWAFLEASQLVQEIEKCLNQLKKGEVSLSAAGDTIRRLILGARFPEDLSAAIRDSYRELGERYGTRNVAVAVRSSATAEDLPEASFAGQQESYLNISGEEALLDACRRCYASLFTNRAISYRQEKGFEHMKVALSIGVQKMVRSDKACAGVMFTLDPETGFSKVIVINAAWGLGESVVQGAVNPDEYIVFKPLLDGNGNYTPIVGKTLGEKAQKVVYAMNGTMGSKSVGTSRSERLAFTLADQEVLSLARWACDIEEHYRRPMDIEWAKDGETGELFIVQARPETVQSQRVAASLKHYQLKERGKRLISGLSIGQAIATGKAQVIKNASEIDRFQDGSILVTGMTDPDWVPIMKRAAGIITDLGGRTSHAAIVSREMGIPAIVGTGEATARLKDGQEITERLNHYSIPTDLPLVVQISRFDRWKDPEGVIQAFKLARKEVDCTLVLVGNVATDDPEGEEVYDSLLESREDRIIIHSVQDGALVNALQRRAAVVLQKSLREGFGLTVAEAMWKGTPVIGGNVGGIRHQIENGVNGFLVSSAEEAAQRIVQLLKDKKLRETMGQRARETVKQKFLLTRYLEQYLDLCGSFETSFRLTDRVKDYR